MPTAKSLVGVEKNFLMTADCRKNPVSGLAKSKIPSTVANDSCHPASNNCVGLVSSSIIAASASVLKGLVCRRKRMDMQNTEQMTAALMIGALGGTMSRKMLIVIRQATARTGLFRPAILQIHHTIPARIPMCIPERLIKCNRPVWRKAL